MFVCLFYLYLSAFPYLYLYLQPMTLGQEGLLTDHLLPSNKIFWIQWKTAIFPMLSNLSLKTFTGGADIPPHLEDSSIDWRLWMKRNLISTVCNNVFSSACMYVLSMLTKHLRGHNLELVKHRSKLELRHNFFTERLINRWNSLDQQSLDVDSVNCFKNHLQRLRNTRMGFFVDWSPVNPLAAQVLTGMATPGKWPGKWVDGTKTSHCSRLRKVGHRCVK